MNMKLKITQEHIDAARQNQHSTCPIKLALEEKFLDTNVFAGYSCAGIGPNGKLWSMSSAARRFAIGFDMGDDIRPTTLEFEEISAETNTQR